MRHGPVWLALTLAAGLHGCGGADEPAPPGGQSQAPAAQTAPSITACELVPTAEVESAMGAPVADVDSSAAPTYSSCLYMGGGKYVTLMLWPGSRKTQGGAEDLARAIDQDNSRMETGLLPAEPVEGLGDAAASVTNARQTEFTFWVEAGRGMLMVQAPSFAAGEQLARRAVERIR